MLVYPLTLTSPSHIIPDNIMEVGVTVKAEITEPGADITANVLELCKKNTKGVSDASMQEHLPASTPQQRVQAINKLLKAGQIELLKSGSTLLYRFKDSQAASKTRGFEVEEKLIYQIIEVADNKGIWIREIRNKCSLPMVQVNKVLKSLEGKKLIKVYMEHNFNFYLLSFFQTRGMVLGNSRSFYTCDDMSTLGGLTFSPQLIFFRK